LVVADDCFTYSTLIIFHEAGGFKLFNFLICARIGAYNGELKRKKGILVREWDLNLDNLNRYFPLVRLAIFVNQK
jgi:hypothetical protein